MDIERPDLKKRKQVRQRALVVAAAMILIALLFSALVFGTSAPEIKQSDILTDVVKRGEFVSAVRGPGKLVPSQSRWVVARTEANVEKVLLQPGATVTANSVILELSNPEVQDKLLAAKAALSAAEADHRALVSSTMTELLELQSEQAAIKGDFESARVEEEASRAGYEKGVIAAVRYKQTVIEVQQLKVRVEIAEKRVAQSKANMQAQTAASRTRLVQLASTQQQRQLEADALQIKAGLDGVVQKIEVEEGQRVTSGFNLARVVRPSTLIAELRIPESQASDLSVGQATTIEIGRSTVSGKVRRFNPVVEKGAILVEVDLVAPLPSGVRSEQSVDGTIFIERLQDTLYVGRPVNSSSQSETTVFRLVGTDTAERVPVRFGKDSISSIQVLSGLREGDKVILSDMSKYDKDNEVTIE